LAERRSAIRKTIPTWKLTQGTDGIKVIISSGAFCVVRAQSGFQGFGTALGLADKAVDIQPAVLFKVEKTIPDFAARTGNSTTVRGLLTHRQPIVNRKFVGQFPSERKSPKKQFLQ